MADLQHPDRSDDLYLVRGADVDARRPILTGDVFENIEIPGVEDGPGLAMVVTHPCSMRGAAGHLKTHVQMARISHGNPIALEAWDGHFGIMPLPDLTVAGDLGSRREFELAGRVRRESLLEGARMACLQEMGILLLMQRLAFHFTRVAITVDELLDSVAHVLEEAELLDEWIPQVPAGLPTADRIRVVDVQEAAFDALMSAGPPGSRLRDRLLDQKLRPGVRRAVREKLAANPAIE